MDSCGQRPTRSKENLKSQTINKVNQHREDREQKTETQYENYKGDETVEKYTKDKENYPYTAVQNSKVLITTVHESSLVCLYLNARSLMNKIDEFHATVSTLQPDIIGVTESWVTENVLDSELELTGYILFRHDRPVKKRGGGVLLYIKTIWQHGNMTKLP